jgi:hypothetical protein
LDIIILLMSLEADPEADPSYGIHRTSDEFSGAFEAGLPGVLGPVRDVRDVFPASVVVISPALKIGGLVLIHLAWPLHLQTDHGLDRVFNGDRERILHPAKDGFDSARFVRDNDAGRQPAAAGDLRIPAVFGPGNEAGDILASPVVIISFAGVIGRAVFSDLARPANLDIFQGREARRDDGQTNTRHPI